MGAFFLPAILPSTGSFLGKILALDLSNPSKFVNWRRKASCNNIEIDQE